MVRETCGNYVKMCFRLIMQNTHSFCTYTLVNHLRNIKLNIMADDNRNQTRQSGQQNQQTEQGRMDRGQRENSSDQHNIKNNPQRGSQWSNYQTRELSSDQGSSSEQDLSDE